MHDHLRRHTFGQPRISSGEERAEAHVHGAFLAEASRLLADSLDYETTLATVAALALPHLGAWCFVDLREPDGRMRRLSVIHPDPEKQVLARQLESGWPPERDDPLGVPRVMRTRRSEVIAEVTDEMLIRASRTEENLGILRRLGIGSLMNVPMIARGEVLGAITFVSEGGGRSYDGTDLEVAEDLAARCAIAIDNARLYQEAQRAQAEAEAAQRVSVEANRAKSLFLATMSHEIRTPLNAVLGYADLLAAGIGGPLSAEQALYVERIQSSNRHLLGLINDVLDLARSDAGRMQIHVEEAVVSAVVAEAIDMVQPFFEKRALRLIDGCDAKAEVRFHGDVSRVRQILVNLISNAIKFTPDRGVIRLSCGVATGPAAAVTGQAPPPQAFIRVEDSGIGIHPDDMARIFEPFVQADSGYARSREGSGLGLAISRRLARTMGGDLTAESRLNEGSAFTLWLPAPPWDGTRAAADAEGEEAAAAIDEIRGVAVIGRHMLLHTDALSCAFVKRLRDASVAPADLPDAVVQDHTASMLSDVAQSLVLLEVSPADAAELLRDGSEILRVIADRHGAQRHRTGWPLAAVDREFDILLDEVERVVREAAAEHSAADAERALELLTSLLEQARRGSIRAFRIAAQRIQEQE